MRVCEKGVTHALHIFSEGPHGLSLANQDWVDGKFGVQYTITQMLRITEKIQNGEIELPAGNIENSEQTRQVISTDRAPNEEVAVWPDIADTWLMKVM